VTKEEGDVIVALRYPEEAYKAVLARGRLGFLYGETLHLADVTGVRDEDPGSVTVTNGEIHMDVRLGGPAIMMVVAAGDRAVKKRAEALREQVQQVLRKHTP